MVRVRRLTYTLCLLGSLKLTIAQVNVNPQSLSFSYQIGGGNPPAQSLFIFSEVPTQFAVTTSGAPWLTVTPTTGVTPNTLVATVTPPAGATAGTLNGTVIIGPPASADNLKLVVPVTLQILPASPGNLVVTPASIVFDYRTGGPNPSPYTLSVTSTGTAAAFTVSASTASGGAWLFVSPNSGVTPAAFSAYVLPAATTAPGTYTGTISVVPSYAGATPQRVSVTLRVSAGGTLTASPNSLTFNYQPGSPIPSPQVLNIATSTGAAMTANVSANTTGGGSWLVVSPGIATTPFSVIVSVNPLNVVPGTYYGNVSVAPAVGGAATLIPVTLAVYSVTHLVVAPESLSFNYQSGGPSPPPQYLAVTSTGVPINFTTSILGPSWISVSSTRATTPTGLGVTVNPPITTAPGFYNATLTLTPASGAQVAVAISVQVTAANYISLDRSSISFAYAPGDPAPPAVIVPVTSSAGSLRFETIASTAGFSPWLKVSQSSQYTPAQIYVSISPAGLTAGTYSGAVSVASDDAVNSPQTINVSLVVSPQPNFSASPFAMVFSYQIGGTAAPMQLAVISNQGAPMSFMVSAATDSGGNWLIAAGGGTTPATIAATVDPAKLGPGTYTGNLVLKAASDAVNPLQVPVILNVSTGPVFRPAGTQVSFQYQRTGPVPASQKVTINAAGSSIVFYTGTSTGDGGKWLKVSPDVAVTPSDVTVSVDPQGLTSGQYYGVIVLTDASGAAPTSFVPVSLQVSDIAILTVPSQALNFAASVGAGPSAPQTILVKGTLSASNFQVNTNGANWLQVNPVSGVTDATLNAVAAPGSMPAGLYFGVVSIEIPGVAASQQYVPAIFTLSVP